MFWGKNADKSWGRMTFINYLLQIPCFWGQRTIKYTKMKLRSDKETKLLNNEFRFLYSHLFLDVFKEDLCIVFVMTPNISQSYGAIIS
jgi:hypothetical protein